MSPRLRSVLPHLVMLAVSIGLYWAAMQIDTRAAEGGRRLGPDFWPKIVIVFMGALCVYEIVKRLLVRTDFTATGLSRGTGQPPADGLPEDVPVPGGASVGVTHAGSGTALDQAPEAEPTYTGKLVAGIAVVIGFVVVVPWLGFFVATMLFLAGFIWLGGYRRALPTALLSVGGALALVVMFMRVAYISLPLGEGPFRALSLALLSLLGVS